MAFNYNPYLSEPYLSNMRSLGFQVSPSAGGDRVTLTRGNSSYTINTGQPRRSIVPSNANAQYRQHAAPSATHNNAYPLRDYNAPVTSVVSSQAYNVPSGMGNSFRSTTNPGSAATESYGIGAYNDFLRQQQDLYNTGPRSGSASHTSSSRRATATSPYGAQIHFTTPAATNIVQPIAGPPTTTASATGGHSYHSSATSGDTTQPDLGPPLTATTTSPAAALNYTEYFTPDSSFSSQTSSHGDINHVVEEQKRCHCGCDAIDFCEDCYSLDCHHVILSWGIEEPRPTCIRQLEAAERQSSPPALRSIATLSKYSRASQLESMLQASLDASSSGIQLISSGVKVSLLCPITMKRMVHPARLEDCEHLQCFDAQSILQIKDQKDAREIRCPVCRKVTIEESSVLLNELTEDILMDPKTQNAKSVVIRADGSWIVEGSRDSESSGTSLPESGDCFEHRRIIIDVESNTTIMESDSD